MASAQSAFKKRLARLMKLPENQRCSDCPERQPRWASLIVPPPGSPSGTTAMGCFVCLECSGAHRRLGVHISFVRSINLDSWKEKEVLAMENGGNARVNMIFEGRLNNPGLKPTTGASGPERERFIRDKYERRKYMDRDALLKIISGESEESDSSDEEEEPVKSPSPSSRKPSDAARRRANARRNRLGNMASSPAKKEINRASAPVSAPVAVADLLDFSACTVEDTAQAAPSVEPALSAAPDSANDDMFGSMQQAPPAAENNTIDNSVMNNISNASTANVSSPEITNSFNPVMGNNNVRTNAMMMNNTLAQGMTSPNITQPQINPMMMGTDPNMNQAMMNQMMQMMMMQQGQGQMIMPGMMNSNTLQNGVKSQQHIPQMGQLNNNMMGMKMTGGGFGQTQQAMGGNQPTMPGMMYGGGTMQGAVSSMNGMSTGGTNQQTGNGMMGMMGSNTAYLTNMGNMMMNNGGSSNMSSTMQHQSMPVSGNGMASLQGQNQMNTMYNGNSAMNQTGNINPMVRGGSTGSSQSQQQKNNDPFSGLGAL